MLKKFKQIFKNHKSNLKMDNIRIIGFKKDNVFYCIKQNNFSSKNKVLNKYFTETNPINQDNKNQTSKFELDKLKQSKESAATNKNIVYYSK
jgi:hypothetical protein